MKIRYWLPALFVALVIHAFAVWLVSRMTIKERSGAGPVGTLIELGPSLSEPTPAPEPEPAPEALEGSSGAASNASDSAAVTPGDASSSVLDYRNLLRVSIAAHHRYPRRARRQRIEGRVGIEFSIDDSGKVLESSILSSSGHAILDDSGLQAIEDASPFPPPPSDVADRIFRLPLVFRLDQAAQ